MKRYLNREVITEMLRFRSLVAFYRLSWKGKNYIWDKKKKKKKMGKYIKHFEK